MTLLTVRPARNRLCLSLIGIAAVAALVMASSTAAHAATPPSVGLGTADSFNVLAHSAVTNTGNSVINSGDVGLDPGTSVVGFPPAVINGGVIHATDAQAEQAQVDVGTAYNDAAGRTPNESNITDLVGRTLVPGVYSGDALSLSGDLTLDGTASSVFIFQAASTLITGSSSRVLFKNGASECNVFWKVGSSATLGSNSTFVGTILALASITAATGASITGRLFARTGAVTLDDNTISRPPDCAARATTVASTPSNATTLRLASEAAARASASAEATRIAAATALATAQSAAARSTARKSAVAQGLAVTGTDSTPSLVTGTLLLLLGAALLILRRWRRARHRA
jgi:LPXTG-motif cell wall-anchored protein